MNEPQLFNFNGQQDETKKEKAARNMDDLIKSISAKQINSGQIECESLHLPKQS